MRENHIVKNREELLSHGERKQREDLLEIIEHALDEVVPAKCLSNLMELKERGFLSIENREYDLSEAENIYVLGAGKGSCAVAKALKEVIGDFIDDGVIVEKTGQADDIDGITVFEAGHPIPDENGFRGGEELVELANSSGKDDLVFACITGGASALLLRPVAGVGIEDLADLTRLLLESGARIEEINAVRKHLSRIKGGQLANIIDPSRIVNLIIVDEVAGEAWGPTVPDETTFEEAVNVLKKYNLWSDTPESIKRHLKRGVNGEESETPAESNLEDLRIQDFILTKPEDVCEAARDKAKELGYNAIILSTMIEGESKEAGTFLSGVAKEVKRYNRPISPPCAIVSGGETTVKVGENSGEGGPNQELALGFALDIGGYSDISAISIGTDGTDGPTDIAGGIVDGQTEERAERKGIDIFENLMEHSSSYVLRELRDAVYTGPTGTNLMDLRVILVGTE